MSVQFYANFGGIAKNTSPVPRASFFSVRRGGWGGGEGGGGAKVLSFAFPKFGGRKQWLNNNWQAANPPGVLSKNDLNEYEHWDST